MFQPDLAEQQDIFILQKKKPFSQLNLAGQWNGSLYYIMIS